MNSNIIQKTFSLFLILGMFLTACESEPSLETKSGFKVKVLRKGGGTPVIENGVAQLNLRYETEDGRVLFDTGERGGPVPVRTSQSDRGIFAEVVDILSIGDSVYFELPAEDLYEKTYRLQLPDSIERGTKLKFNLCLSNSITMSVMEALQHEEEEKHEAEQLERDIETIDVYLQYSGIEAKKLESGLRYVVHEKGKGPQPKLGDRLKVHYVGKFFDSNTIFDQSDQNGEPFPFNLGSGVIEGWSLGFAELTVGSKATFYIPSKLAYGHQGYAGVIPPHSILVFDVELVDIER